MEKKGEEKMHNGGMNLNNVLQPVFAKYADILAAVYLFGSAVTGEATCRSDLDIAVLFAPGAGRFPAKHQFALYADLSRTLQRNDIDLVILNASRNLILQEEILRRGALIFDGDSAVRADYEQRILHLGIDFRHQRAMVMGM